MNLGETRRRQYLEAMGVPVWERRGAPAVAFAVGAEEPAAQAYVAVPSSDPAAAPGAALPPPSLESWGALQAEVRGCMKCGLHKTRTQTVFGVGNPQAAWMFIGEAPGADEDAQGEPFVGRAGQLLNAMLFAMGLKREEVYIANVLKCRPPGNRDPQPGEVEQCEPYLLRQIAHIEPKLIVALGRHAAHSLLKTELPLARLRGQKLDYHGTPLIVTYHPAYLLRSPGEKRKAWEDLVRAKAVMASL